MKRFLVILFISVLASYSVAQKKNSQSQRTAHVTQKKTKKQSGSRAKTNNKKQTSNSKTTQFTNASIKGLQNQRSQIKKKIQEQERALRKNKADVKQRLDHLIAINAQIDERQKVIDGIQQDIHQINGNIDILKAQLATLEQQLADRKSKYIKSMRYMAHHRTVQDKLMFIFSAKNFAQMYRRLRFVRQYADYQKAQGEMVKAKQAQVTNKHQQLQDVKGQKSNLLYKGQQEKNALQGQQEEQKKAVASLQRDQKTIEKVLQDQRAKDAALNAKIDKIIAEEVAKARARAAAEAKRKAAEAKAAAERKAAELARKKAEAEALARENERKRAEAKAREERLKAEAAKASAEKNISGKVNKIVSRKTLNKKEIAEVKKEVESVEKFNTVDRMLSGGFENNKGRLPMPITGNYKIVSHFGQYNVEGLKGVRLDNKGINIQGTSGCRARAVYDGEVSAVFGYNGNMVVMVRHGAYISVYCNLSSVTVSRGQKVATRQILGSVGSGNILQFQLRKETAKLNPESWLGR